MDADPILISSKFERPTDISDLRLVDVLSFSITFFARRRLFGPSEIDQTLNATAVRIWPATPFPCSCAITHQATDPRRLARLAAHS